MPNTARWTVLRQDEEKRRKALRDKAYDAFLMVSHPLGAGERI